MNRRERRAAAKTGARPASAPASALFAAALQHHREGRLAEAHANCQQILRLNPTDVDALHLDGLIAGQAGYTEAAVDRLTRAVSLQARDPALRLNLAEALRLIGRYDDAITQCRQALGLNPDFVEAWVGLGKVLLQLERHEEALAANRRALALAPDHPVAHNNLGTSLLALGAPDPAEAAFTQALAINPNYAEALYNRGTCRLEPGRQERAAEDFARLLAINPDYDYARGNYLFANLACANWANYNQSVALILGGIEQGKHPALPFVGLSTPATPAMQLACGRAYAAHKYPAPEALWQGERYDHDRIRVAYLSADFYNHATAYLMAGLFETHDKSRFETTGISFGPDRDDPMRRRLATSFDRFVDVRSKSDRDIALLLKSLEIDIAIDLKGYTQGSRPGILAFRPAPVQVNYLGFPGTMGADHIDYILADRFVIPADQQVFYTEKVVHLPDSYYPNNYREQVANGAKPTRIDAGLPATGFVFCSFNNTYKMTPWIFDIWMRLLLGVEGSVLWLLEDDAATGRNLRREAQSRCVAPDRLIFAPRARSEDHLARHGLADLMLDTLPYNAHTTATDALWSGLPIVTCAGPCFAGRVAGSLLTAAGLPELITQTLEDYEALALKLARDPAALAAIKAKLARNRESSPLFDRDRLRRHIERAYETMWGRYQRGEPPASFVVEPIP